MSRNLRKLAPLLVAVLLTAGCATPGAPPVAPPLRDARRAPLVPDEADHAAADLAAAALVGDAPGAVRASARIAAFDAERERGPTGLAPAAAELWNAASMPGRASWREASETLLARDDLDPALRERIERALDDDPLVQANANLHDARLNDFASLFNAVVEPIGQSLLNTALAPYRLGRSLIRYGVHLYRRDPLPLERRQALAHWKQFLARYPDAKESPEVAARVEGAETRWRQTMRRHALSRAEAALDADLPREALIYSERALRYAPENERAEEIRQRAGERLLALREANARSVEFALPEGRPLQGDATRAQAIALLTDADPPAGAGEPDAAEASALRFARASRLEQRSREREARALLGEIADGDGDRDAMVRHASAALADPVRNPWDTFARARNRDRGKRALWLLIGPFAESEAPDEPDEALMTLVELPRMAQVLLSLPLRLLQLPFTSPLSSSKVTAVQARRYLRLHPHGVHADEVMGWLEGYESRRDNPLGALEIAERRDPQGDHARLREQAASQMLRVASREERTDLRRAMLAGVTRRFPDTEAGDTAGRQVREEIDDWTPHHVELTRGFLLENPDVTGVQGLDLDPALLDGDGRNGELHPDGLALVGGRVIEMDYLGVSGDEDDPPQVSYVQLSPERFARLVARLEETSFRNALLDDDDAVRPDAQRDDLFERARLGLADEIDRRATASSDFTYRGLRERYGIVRRREPILPFDLVVQGSLSDLSLGAFPRMRSADEPKDALLYE
jgi:hypothetical protein